jgi:hypothetical protein
MKDEKRIGSVPWEPDLPVTTAWDLGMRDATSIWFLQQHHGEIRLIDYYESSGVGLDHYHKVLRDKPYAYDQHLAPHDISVMELGTGKSRMEIARKMGIRFRAVKKLPLEDGINAVRLFLPKCWIDEKKCSRGLQALHEYVKQKVLGEEDMDGKPIYRDLPLHNWASNGADALRTAATGLKPPRAKHDGPLAPKLAIV